MSNVYKLYITYGNCYRQHNCYSVVVGKDYDDCRAKAMAGTNGGRYAFHYTEERFAGQPERYNLTEIPLQPQCRDDGTHPWDACKDDDDGDYPY